MADVPPYVVVTTHVQQLLENALRLARECNAVSTDDMVPVEPDQNVSSFVPLVHALEKAATDAAHAAEELRTERLACLGWKS